MYFAERSAKANGLPTPIFYKFYCNFIFSASLKVQVAIYSKVGKSYSKQEILTRDLDLCQLQSVTTNSLFLAFLPDISDQLSTVFQPCPYSVGYDNV
jgi:hypothetical protein